MQQPTVCNGHKAMWQNSADVGSVKMRVFVCGDELGLGFVVAQRLLSQGHKVMMLTNFDDLIPNLTKNGVHPVRGQIQDAAPQRQLAKADAVIDTSVPSTYPLKKGYVSRLRPSLLRRALEGSGRPLIMTSSAAVLGDTGSRPMREDAPIHPLPGFAWLPRLEEEILKSSGSRGMVIRPAWLVHGPSRVGNRDWKLDKACEALQAGKIHWIGRELLLRCTLRRPSRSLLRCLEEICCWDNPARGQRELFGERTGHRHSSRAWLQGRAVQFALQ
jgi:hypothetical protein